MDMKLLISKQRNGEKLVVDITEEGVRGLISLIHAAQQLGADVGANREIPVTVLRNNPFPKVHKTKIFTEEEFTREAAEEGVDLSRGKPMQGRFFVDVRRQALVVVTFSEQVGLDGRTERTRDDMTIGLRESDLTVLLGRALSRIDMSNRELRQAEQGARDRRRGRAGKEARQRVGKLKQELHNSRQRPQEGSAEGSQD